MSDLAGQQPDRHAPTAALRSPSSPHHALTDHDPQRQHGAARPKSDQSATPATLLFTTHDLELRRGECAALIGPNGAGKTTFLTVLLGQLAPLCGRGEPGRQPEGRLLRPGPRGAQPGATRSWRS